MCVDIVSRARNKQNVRRSKVTAWRSHDEVASLAWAARSMPLESGLSLDIFNILNILVVQAIREMSMTNAVNECIAHQCRFRVSSPRLLIQ